jgi:hypothetical protein
MRIVSRPGPIVGASLVVIACTASVTSAFAQQVEASFEGGYTGSNGFTVTQSRQLFGQIYNNLDITSGGSFGLTIGAYVRSNFEVEFLWHRQFSTLQASNPAPAKTLANQDVDNYHANLVYNWGDGNAKVRPFVFGGVGATHYVPGDYDPSIPNSATLSRIGSVTKFSSTWGGGVKVYLNPYVGLKTTLRWTPTYIKTDPSGLWCDPFYGTCWVVGNPQYSNQFDVSGGVTVRFGGR